MTREQIANHTYRRASATPEELAARRTVANPHRAGYHAGLHPEDQPYTSEDFYTEPKMPRSAIRYSSYQEATTGQPPVIYSGNRKYVLRESLPQGQPRQRDTQVPP